MTPTDQLERITLLTSRINAEVTHAIALHALWEQCADGAGVVYALREEPAFPVVRDSLLIQLLMTLIRLYDKPNQSITIPKVIQMISDSANCEDWSSMVHAKQAIEQYGELQSSGILNRVRTLRDRVLAHNDKHKLNEPLFYNEETILLKHTADIATHLHRAATGCEPQFEQYRETWNLCAKSFWSRAGDRLISNSE